MNTKKIFIVLLTFLIPPFFTYASEEAPQLDECSQKILKEGAVKIIAQEIKSKTDFIFWQQEMQRIIAAITTFDYEYAQELQNQFTAKKNSIAQEHLTDEVSSAYKKDMDAFLETLKHFEDTYATSENQNIFNDVTKTLEQHTSQTTSSITE